MADRESGTGTCLAATAHATLIADAHRIAGDEARACQWAEQASERVEEPGRRLAWVRRQATDWMLGRLRAGDEQAKVWVWQTEWPELVRVAQRVTRSADRAQDCADEALCRFLVGRMGADGVHRPPAFQAADTVRPYLRVVVERLALDVWRATQKERALEESVAAGRERLEAVVPAPAYAPDELVAEREMHRLLAQCRIELAADAGYAPRIEAARLHSQEGLRGAELSRAMGRTGRSDALRAWAARAVRAGLGLLRECLRQKMSAARDGAQEEE